ncbi:MAG: hypothetical protein NVSMB46_08950 [Candidatus Saccharimonadales bacterium]
MLFFNDAVASNYPIAGLKLEQKDIGLLTPANLIPIVRSTVRSSEQQEIIIKLPSYSSHVNSEQLGAHYNSLQIMSQLTTFGRHENIFRQILDQDEAFFGIKNERLGFATINTTVAKSFLLNLNAQIEKEPIDAKFSYSNKTLQIANNIEGYKIDTVATILALQKIQFSQSTLQFNVPLHSLSASIQTKNLQPLLEEATKLLSAPIILNANSVQLILDQQTLASLLTAKKITDKATHESVFQLSFNNEGLTAVVDNLASKVNEPGSPTISYGKTTIAPGSPTTKLEDDTDVKTAIIATMLSRKKEPPTQNYPTQVQIPVQKFTPPPISQYSITNPLGKYPAQVNGKNTVYLTFDDGPGGSTNDVLNTLKKYNVHAIFFVVGKNANKYPDSIKRMVADGHTVANHSFTHSDLGILKESQISDELSQTQNAIQNTGGGKADLFRPPYGSLNAEGYRVMKRLNLNLLMWDNDPRDWSKPGSAIIVQRVLNQAKPGSNILLHSIHKQTSDALPAIIEGLRAKGYTLN